MEISSELMHQKIEIILRKMEEMRVGLKEIMDKKLLKDKKEIILKKKDDIKRMNKINK